MQEPLLASYFTPPFELVYNTTKHHLWSWKRKHTEVWLKERGGGLVGTLLTFSCGDSWTFNSVELCNPFEPHIQHLAFCKNTLLYSQGLSELNNSPFVSFSVLLRFCTNEEETDVHLRIDMCIPCLL